MPEKKQQDQDSTPDQTPQVDNQPQEQAPVTPEKPKKLDETVPGGRYKTADGRYVNANGEELK